MSNPVLGQRTEPRNADVVREIETMMGCSWKYAKEVFDLARLPVGSERKIGRSRGGGLGRTPMTQENAAKIVAAARERIALIDEGD